MSKTNGNSNNGKKKNSPVRQNSDAFQSASKLNKTSSPKKTLKNGQLHNSDNNPLYYDFETYLIQQPPENFVAIRKYLEPLAPLLKGGRRFVTTPVLNPKVITVPKLLEYPFANFQKYLLTVLESADTIRWDLLERQNRLYWKKSSYKRLLKNYIVTTLSASDLSVIIKDPSVASLFETDPDTILRHFYCVYDHPYPYDDPVLLYDYIKVKGVVTDLAAIIKWFRKQKYLKSTEDNCCSHFIHIDGTLIQYLKQSRSNEKLYSSNPDQDSLSHEEKMFKKLDLIIQNQLPRLIPASKETA